MQGPHFEATLREFATLLIKRSFGCHLLQGPFSIPPSVALAKVLSCWGSSRLTWTAQRELATQVIRGVEAHKVDVAFLRTSALRDEPRAVQDHVTLNNRKERPLICRTGGQRIGLGSRLTGDHNPAPRI
jgi:hypothetical protein